MESAGKSPNLEFTTAAAGKLNRHTTADGRLFGDVAAAVVSKDGNTYYGVCLDTPSWGLCAERSAIAALAPAGEYRIDKVVAVWKAPDNDRLHVLPPCGICREFMLQVDRDNLDTQVVLRPDETTTLRELMPHQEW